MNRKGLFLILILVAIVVGIGSNGKGSIDPQSGEGSGLQTESVETGSTAAALPHLTGELESVLSELETLVALQERLRRRYDFRFRRTPHR